MRVPVSKHLSCKTIARNLLAFGIATVGLIGGYVKKGSGTILKNMHESRWFTLFWMLFLTVLMVVPFLSLADSIKSYDDAGNCILEMFYNEDGIPEFHENSYYGVAKKYEGSKCVEITYLDASGNPMINKSGYAVIKRTFDDSGHVTQEMYFDVEGRPVALWGGQYGIKYESWDDKGRAIQFIYLDAEANPLKISSGYSAVKRTFDDFGHVTQEMYFDMDDHPATSWARHYGIRYEDWDENNRSVQYTFLDVDGNPMKTKFGYSTIKRKYNEQGRVEYNYFYDINGNPAKLSNGQYGEYHEYDEEGRDIRITYLNINREPFITYLGYATIRREYEDGKINVEWYYDLDDQKIDIGRGQYGTRYIYKGNTVKEKVAIDKDGKDIFLLDQFLDYHLFWVLFGGLIAIIAAVKLPKKPMLFLYILFIFYMTLYVREMRKDTPVSFELFRSVREAFDVGFTWEAWKQIINNILLFVPFGFMLYIIWNKPWTFLVPFLLSVLIECTQYFFGLGWCELDDVVWNTMGGAIGIGLGILKEKIGGSHGASQS